MTRSIQKVEWNDRVAKRRNLSCSSRWRTTSTRSSTFSWTVIEAKLGFTWRSWEKYQIEELKRFQGSTFDTIARRRLVEDEAYLCEVSVPNPSIWKESLTWIVRRIRLVRGWNLEWWRTGRRPWGVGDDGRIGNLLEKTQCERGDISQTRRIYFSNRRWTNQTPWRRSGTENIHLDTGPPNSRRE